jgi:hypothetical protein
MLVFPELDAPFKKTICPPLTRATLTQRIVVVTVIVGPMKGGCDGVPAELTRPDPALSPDQLGQLIGKKLVICWHS